jgi:hypothetical protein
MIHVRFPAAQAFFSCIVLRLSGVHPATYPLGTRGCSLCGEVARAWSCQLNSYNAVRRSGTILRFLLCLQGTVLNCLNMGTTLLHVVEMFMVLPSLDHLYVTEMYHTIPRFVIHISYRAIWMVCVECLTLWRMVSAGILLRVALVRTFLYIYIFFMSSLPIEEHYVRFEVFTAVTMKNGGFWDVTLCGSCKNPFYLHYYYHLAG